MNLVCFPPYGAGGYVCDVLNGTASLNYTDGTVGNPFADSLKITVPRSFRTFRRENKLAYEYFFQKKVKEVKNKFDEHIWLGTHCYPDEVNTTEFNKVVVISTENAMSKVYRLMRVYFMYEFWGHRYSPNEDKKVNLEEKINNIDLSLYNFNYHNVVQPNARQLELEDIVNDTTSFNELVQEFSNNVDLTYLNDRKKNWQSKNSFLYDTDLVEVFKNRYYTYMQS